MKRLVVILLAMSVPACFGKSDVPFVVMKSDLGQLKHDFNDAVDQVRLVFIVGPT